MNTSNRRRDIFAYAVGFIAIVFCIWVATTLRRNDESPAPIPPISPTIFPTQETQIPVPSITDVVSATLEPSPTTSIPPTAVPLPIREDFSTGYSDLWTVVGNPVITGDVLTSRPGESITFLIGNTGWKNYVVSLKANLLTGADPWPSLFIGVRVIDLNNMIGLDCTYFNECTWVVIRKGGQDRLPITDNMVTSEGLTITVQDNVITAQSSYNTIAYRMSLVIPKEYEEVFTAGGFMLRMTSAGEVDYIQIDPLP
jgi:hypothetical protein